MEPQALANGTLRDVAEQRELRLAGITVYGRRRRPAGSPGVLHRRPRLSGWSWAAALSILVVLWATVVAVNGSSEWWFERDADLADWLSERRTAWLDEVAGWVRTLGSAWFVRLLLVGAALVMAITRRWRHLVTFAAVVLVAEWLASRTSVRPDAVEDLQASVPMATVAATTIGAGFSLLPPGRWRNAWLTVAGVILALVALARLYLAEDLSTDAVVGGALGVALAVTSFRLLVPDSAFPISYALGQKAHLPVKGRRAAQVRAAVYEQILDPGSAMHTGARSALLDQLGCELVACHVIDIKPHGLEGSAGSTPLRVDVAGEPDGSLFCKLYATNHLRSDRWYKLFRAIAYGGLEDERSFSSVRRLVEYEDYMLRVFDGAGLNSAKPFGIVSLSPEREYLVVTEFFEGAQEMSEVEITDDVVDQSLRIVRGMWDAGLAHRDIKPANLLVVDGEVKLIDVAFGTVRPSPWREAIDLANMMLVLALHRAPQEVYARALREFSAGDIAEAFAATQGVTMPSQLRQLVKEHNELTGVDLVDTFRTLGPQVPRIAIQRWSLRRLWVTAGFAAAVLALVVLLFSNLRGAGLL